MCLCGPCDNVSPKPLQKRVTHFLVLSEIGKLLERDIRNGSRGNAFCYPKRSKNFTVRNDTCRDRREESKVFIPYSMYSCSQMYYAELVKAQPPDI